MRRFHFLAISIVAFAALLAGVGLADIASASHAPAGPKRPGPERPVPKPSAVSAVRLSSLPDPSQAREPVLLSGALVGRATTGVRVTLWRKRPRDKQFHPVLVTRSDIKGHFAVLVSGARVDTNTWWYATAGEVTSPTVLERVRALMTLKSSITGAVPGQPVQLSGRVIPWHGGDMLEIQQLAANGQWEEITSTRLSRGSNFSVPYAFTTGTAHVRALLQAGSRNSRSISSAVTLDVDADPQDPARRHHHAGEPLVRLLLRHLPRRRRDPGRACACPTRSTAAASSRSTTPPT